MQYFQDMKDVVKSMIPKGQMLIKLIKIGTQKLPDLI